MAIASRSAHLKKPQRLLVPVDLSVLSYQALDVALSLAGPRAKIRLFHASPSVHSAVAYGVDGAIVPVCDPVLSAAQVVYAKRVLTKKAVAFKRKLQVEAVESSHAAQAIAQVARRFKADLIVMTTHGRGGLSRLLSGSEAQKLFHLYEGVILMLRPKHQRGKR